MNKEKFLEYLSVYGADVKRWPEDMRFSASDFFQTTDKEIKRAIEEEASFEALLGADDPMPSVSIALEAQLLDLMPEPKIDGKAAIFSNLFKLTTPKWMTAGLISASLFGGVTVGYAQALEQVELEAVNSMLAYVSSEELSDLNSDEWLAIEEGGND